MNADERVHSQMILPLIAEVERQAAEIADLRHNIDLIERAAQQRVERAEQRAEKIRDALLNLNAYVERMQERATEYLTSTQVLGDFVHSLIYMLDGPEQRAVQKTARAALGADGDAE